MGPYARDYLKEHRPVLYNDLILSCKLWTYLADLNQQAQEPDFGDGESVLTLLYEAYNEVNTMDDAKIRADFHQLYELMNEVPLRDMDKIIYPVCTLCRDHERSGFTHGVQIDIRLAQEAKIAE